MSRVFTTFPEIGEFRKGKAFLDAEGLGHEVVSPEPGYRLVGVPSLVMDALARSALASRERDVVCSGWVEHRPANISVPSEEPPSFEDDVFGQVAIMVLAPCVADDTKIRLIAHISGDLTEVFPYMNTVMETASYNKHGHTFTFMDGYRMISLYPHRITIAKADEIVDAWRVLEKIRCLANGVWGRHDEIEPCYEMREKPPALEIFKRLPGTNCRVCGERTCLAFAVSVHAGELPVAKCVPVFSGEYTQLKAPLVEICRGLGVTE